VSVALLILFNTN